MSQVKGYKLVSGEEIIGKPVNGDEISITLDDARVLGVQPGPQGISVSFLPVVMLARHQDKTTIFKSSIMVETNVDSDMEKEYRKAVSGIELPN